MFYFVSGNITDGNGNIGFYSGATQCDSIIEWYCRMVEVFRKDNKHFFMMAYYPISEDEYNMINSIGEMFI